MLSNVVKQKGRRRHNRSSLHNKTIYHIQMASTKFVLAIFSVCFGTLLSGSRMANIDFYRNAVNRMNTKLIFRLSLRIYSLLAYSILPMPSSAKTSFTCLHTHSSMAYCILFFWLLYLALYPLLCFALFGTFFFFPLSFSPPNGITAFCSLIGSRLYCHSPTSSRGRKLTFLFVGSLCYVLAYGSLELDSQDICSKPIGK